jgi:hypothetical protein
MIALLVIIYTAVVLVLFKVLRIKPTAFRIAGLVLVGDAVPIHGQPSASRARTGQVRRSKRQS